MWPVKTNRAPTGRDVGAPTGRDGEFAATLWVTKRQDQYMYGPWANHVPTFP